MPTDPTPAPENPPVVVTRTRYDSAGRCIETAEFALDPTNPPDDLPDWVAEEVAYLGYDRDGNVIEKPEPPARTNGGPLDEPDDPHVVG